MMSDSWEEEKARLRLIPLRERWQPLEPLLACFHCFTSSPVCCQVTLSPSESDTSQIAVGGPEIRTEESQTDGRV